MDASGWLGIAAGVLLASLHGLMQRWADRVGDRAETHQRFVTVTLGGLTVRLLVVLALSALVLAFAPVQPAPFVVTLLVLLVGCLLARVRRTAHQLS